MRPSRAALRTAILALGVAACGGARTAPGPRATAKAALALEPGAAAAAHRPLPGDTLVLRFVDRAAEAVVAGDLAGGWRRIVDHPQRSLLPYGHLVGDAAYRAVQIALTDADVDHYGRGADDAASHSTRHLDAVWNRTRGVYLSRQALYLPGAASQIYRVHIPPGARIETALGLLASHRPGLAARFRILVNGHAVLDERLAADETWHRRAVDLHGWAGREVTISFSVDSALDGAPTESLLHGFFANPIIWAPGELPGPNVVFILVDTLRADALSVMPRVRSLAAGSARFEHAITAAAWTRPSMLAMYGGDLPTSVGQPADEIVTTDRERRGFYRRAPPLVPRLLSSRGYRVSAIGNNFFLLSYPQIGLDFGFEEVDDVRDPVKDTQAITRATIRYLEDNQSRPFFLHVHYDAPHWPYTPPPAFSDPAHLAGYAGDAALQKDPLFSRYLGEAAYADDAVGQVIDALDRLGLRERTMVVVVGDHGEIFDPKHDQIVSALGLRTLHHHGWSAYDELLHVPLVISMPRQIPAVDVTAQVRLFDLAATILDYLDVPGDLLPARGRSLRPLIDGKDHADRVAFTEGQNVRAVRSGGLSYLRRGDGRLVVGGKRTTVFEELYDLGRDPYEHDNLAAREPEMLAGMRALYAHESPTAPDPIKAVYHLVLAPDESPHRVTGSLSLDGTGGRIAVRGVRGGEAQPRTEDAIDLSFDGAASLDFSVEPPESGLILSLRRDGVPIEAARILGGEFALPILDGPLSAERLERLNASRPPEPGHRGDVILYRDRSAHALGPPLPETAGGNSTDEVSGMMQRWGYAQPGGSKAAKPR